MPFYTSISNLKSFLILIIENGAFKSHKYCLAPLILLVNSIVENNRTILSERRDMKKMLPEYLILIQLE